MSFYKKTFNSFFRKALSIYYLFLLSVLFLQVNNSIIGIDLGSEFLKIALYDNKSFQMVENLQSKTKTPFAIGFKDDERVFGTEASVKKSKIPEAVFTKMQEFLGKEYQNLQVEEFLRNYFISYDIEEDKDRKVYNFQINFGLDKKKYLLSIEEIYGMMFRYIKFLSDKFSQSDIKECLITVPSFYGYKQRLSITQAVEMSGLKLLHLISENTGAAVNYAMNNRFMKNNTYLILYNMGAFYTQVSLVSFRSRYELNPKDTNKTIENQYISVIDETWNENLGGRNFDYNIVKSLIKEFYQKNNKHEDLKYLEENTNNENTNNENTNSENTNNENNNSENINSFKNKFFKISEKILPFAIKYKEVLSANKEANVNILGVEDGINLSSTLTRAYFEELSKKDFKQVYTPVKNLLERNKNILIEDITAIEFIGGGTRIPKIKEMFKDYVPSNKIGTHMNGDDSIALGTAFIAANYSMPNGIVYNHKKTNLVNYGNNYELKIKIKNLDESNSILPLCEKSEIIQTPVLNCIRGINKEAKVIKNRSGFNLNKVVSFKHDSDIMIEVYQHFDYTSTTNTSSFNKKKETPLLKYKILLHDSIIHQILNEKGYNNTMPRIHLKFATDNLGIIILKAEIGYEVELYLSAVKDSKGKFNFKYTTEITEPLSANDLIDEIGKINNDKNMSKAEKDIIIKKLKNEIGKIKIETKKKDLIVEPITEGTYPLPLTRTQIIRSKVKLNNFDSIDELRALNAEKRNLLESILYSKKEWIESEDSVLFGDKEELEIFKKTLEEIYEWNESIGFKSEAGVISEKITIINSLFNKFEDRIEIVGKRKSLIENFQKEMNATYTEASKLIEMKPWVEEYFKTQFTEKFNSVKNFINEKIETQEKMDLYEKPVLTEDDIYYKLEQIKMELKKIKRMPKPVQNEEI